MTEQVMEVWRSRSWANERLKHYAKSITALEATDIMGVKLKQVQGVWQIVLVDRREE